MAKKNILTVDTILDDIDEQRNGVETDCMVLDTNRNINLDGINTHYAMAEERHEDSMISQIIDGLILSR